MTSEVQAQFGVIGLGVMGANLALNAEEKGFPVAVYDRAKAQTDKFMAKADGKQAKPTFDPGELAQALALPRRILVMVPAGAPVDATIDGLIPHLSPGDVIIDGGNEFYTNTERRSKDLDAKGIEFVGMGVSGGADGARNGPSLMPGGQRAAYDKIASIMEKIAAQVEDGPCVTYIGPGGAGHYVKMVHNGIEYGDMQLIAETYDLLKYVGGLTNDELADVFAEWNRGELESFLIEITSKIFRQDDPETDGRLVDAILDTAQMKGTGSWTVQEGARLAAPIPTIASSVDARVLSAMRDLRLTGAELLKGPTPAVSSDDKRQLIDDARAALYAAKMCSYAQGLGIMKLASEEHDWNLQLGEIARIWKAGCIIRAKFLGVIQGAYGRDPSLANLLFDATFAEDIGRRQDGWRRTVARAVHAGIPVPTLTASLAYYDSLRRQRLPRISPRPSETSSGPTPTNGWIVRVRSTPNGSPEKRRKLAAPLIGAATRRAGARTRRRSQDPHGLSTRLRSDRLFDRVPSSQRKRRRSFLFPTTMRSTRG